MADTLGDTSLLVAASTGNPEVVKVGSPIWLGLIPFDGAHDGVVSAQGSEMLWLLFSVGRAVFVAIYTPTALPGVAKIQETSRPPTALGMRSTPKCIQAVTVNHV